ncbi:MAG TPA: molybdate ABC transporter permease subunit [Terriglobia bacterium]
MTSALSSIDWFPFWLSLQVAAIATVLSLGLGLALAYVLARYDFRGREMLDSLITLPIVLPPTVLGYYLLVLLGRNTAFGRAFETVFGFPLVFTWQAAVVAATFHSVPLLVKSARAALESVDRNLENAARTLGASEARIFWQVTLPLAQRSILAATVFAFARALGDFGVTIMIAGNIPGKTQTMAVAIYDAVQAGNTLPANIMVLIISITAIGILYATNRLQGERLL